MTESPNKEKYNIKWEGFEWIPHFSSTLILPDVTLVSEDNVVRKSHRILLATLSPYLKDLMLCAEEDIIIHLDGIAHQYLDIILQVLHTGKVYLSSETDVIKLLKICMTLGINIFNDQIMLGKETSNPFDMKTMKKRPKKEGIDQQNEIERSSKKFKCVYCNRFFRLRSNLYHHIKGVHEKVRYPCDNCEKQFYDRRLLKNHRCLNDKGITDHEYNKDITQKNAEGLYQCVECGKSFNNQSNFSAHVKAIHKHVKFFCKECSGKFSHRSNLRKHILSVHENVQYFCHNCNKAFNDQSNLRAHKRKLHGYCGCDDTFVVKGQFNQHKEKCTFSDKNQRQK